MTSSPTRARTTHGTPSSVLFQYTVSLRGQDVIGMLGAGASKGDGPSLSRRRPQPPPTHRNRLFDLCGIILFSNFAVYNYRLQ